MKKVFHAALSLFGTSLSGAENSARSFELTVEHVFYVQTIDRVIVVGVVKSGSVKAGDRLVVRSSRGALPVTVERLDHPKKKDIAAARAGDDIGLVLVGIKKDQVSAGDLLTNEKKG